MSKVNREKVKEKAKEIIDGFVKELDKVKGLEEARVEREEDRREEDDGKETDSNFKERLLENAPKSSKGYIKSERGDWEK